METTLAWPAEGQIDEFMTDDVTNWTIIDTLARLDDDFDVLGSLTERRENTVEAAMRTWRFPTVERISPNVLRVCVGHKDVDFNLDANIMVDTGGRRRRSYIERNRVTLEEVDLDPLEEVVCEYMN